MCGSTLKSDFVKMLLWGSIFAFQVLPVQVCSVYKQKNICTGKFYLESSKINLTFLPCMPVKILPSELRCYSVDHAQPRVESNSLIFNLADLEYIVGYNRYWSNLWLVL